jgi:TPR repeat protein
MMLILDTGWRMVPAGVRADITTLSLSLVNPFSAFDVLTDEATQDDEFGRDIYIGSLRQVIESAASPLVVALYGAWGSGKTSMMMRLREQLEGQNSSGRRLAATVWFDPWEQSNDDQPAVSLLYAIRKDLNLENDPKVRHALVAIAQAVATEVQVPYLGISVNKITDAYRKLADEDVEKRTKQAELRARFGEVVEAAKEAAGSLPIVIFIDDLDRCRPATAVAILDAMKLFFNLPGCIFILGADRQHLEAALRAEYKGLEIPVNNYLDKIIQFPFTIPALTAKSVRSYIHNHTSTGLWDCAPMLASAAPNNPRHLKRLINSLTFLDYIARVSVFPDYDNRVMCALTLIQNTAPELYEHLRNNPGHWPDVASLGYAQTAQEAPEWLKEMLTGSEAKTHLEVALRLLPEAAREADIVSYLTLRQQIEGGYADPEQPAFVYEPHPAWPGATSGNFTDEQPQLRPQVQRLLDESLEDAEFWYRQAASSGDPSGMADLAELLRTRGKTEEAELWYQNLADDGDVSAMTRLGDLFESRGQGEQAETWYRRAIGEGDTGAMVALARLLEARGEIKEAEDLYRKGVEAGDHESLLSLARLRENREAYDEAEVWYERGALLGIPEAMTGLGKLLEHRGAYGDAETWYKRAALRGDARAMTGLGNLLDQRGAYDEAQPWFEQSANAGDVPAMVVLAEILEHRGEFDRAREWYRQAATVGNTKAMARLADLLEYLGNQEDAAMWRRLLTDSSQQETPTSSE